MTRADDLEVARARAAAAERDLAQATRQLRQLEAEHLAMLARFRHRHQASPDDPDTCYLCGYNFRNAIHCRIEQPPGDAGRYLLRQQPLRRDPLGPTGGV